jgi:hypothetical protein
VDELTRRRFLERTGWLALAGFAAQLPTRWLDAARATALKPDLVHDTINGLVAFIVPGPDAYSKAQGETTSSPGGIAAGTTQALIDTIDLFLKATPPFSATVAALLNGQAEQLSPRGSKFQSAFANLSFQQKGEVFRRLESLTDPAAGSIRFLAGNLPGLVAFLAYSDPKVGWKLSHYSGTADGRRELKGYFQGRKSVA